MTAFDWQAQWIWAANTDATRHFYFRRDFDLPSKPVSATLRITADDRYSLNIGNVSLGRGPARSKPLHQSYDERDVRFCLAAGHNALSVVAAHYGIGTPILHWQAGITRAIRYDVRRRLDPDDWHGREWKTFAAPYEIGYERMCIMLAYPEVFDFRRQPPIGI